MSNLKLYTSECDFVFHFEAILTTANPSFHHYLHDRRIIAGSIDDLTIQIGWLSFFLTSLSVIVHFSPSLWSIAPSGAVEY